MHFSALPIPPSTPIPSCDAQHPHNLCITLYHCLAKLNYTEARGTVTFQHIQYVIVFAIFYQKYTTTGTIYIFFQIRTILHRPLTTKDILTTVHNQIHKN